MKTHSDPGHWPGGHLSSSGSSQGNQEAPDYQFQYFHGRYFLRLICCHAYSPSDLTKETVLEGFFSSEKTLIQNKGV